MNKQPLSLEGQSILHLNILIFIYYGIMHFLYPRMTWEYHSMEFRTLKHKTYIII